MPPSQQVDRVLRLYPQIFFACHRRHVSDRRLGRSLSANQAGILDHLDDREPTNLRTLARHMGVTSSTMSLNVDRLERAGYLRRRRARDDTRRIELRLTESGRRIKQRQGVMDPKRVTALLKRLTPRERHDAVRGLQLLATAARDLAAGWQQAKGKHHVKRERKFI